MLATFKPDERELAGEMVAVGADAAERWLRDGIDEAMNAFNGVEAGRLGVSSADRRPTAAYDASATPYHGDFHVVVTRR